MEVQRRYWRAFESDRDRVTSVKRIDE